MFVVPEGMASDASSPSAELIWSRELPSGAMLDWELMPAELAGERPWWEPDERHGYHVNTFGFLGGELVQRASGKSFDRFFREEVADPLELDFHFGLDPKHDARTAEFQFIGSKSPEELREAAGDETLLRSAQARPYDEQRAAERAAQARRLRDLAGLSD